MSIFQIRFETILPENIVVIDTSASKVPTLKRKKKTTVGSVGIGTTESDEEEDKLIEEAQTEEGSDVLRLFKTGIMGDGHIWKSNIQK